ncbi:hypothetical protein GBAR_LOCUS1984, partial [Geodia barretti]
YTISVVATSEHLFSDATTFQITLIPAPGQVLVSVSSITATSISLSWSVSSGRVASWEVVWRPTDRGTESTSGPLSGTTYTIHYLDPSTIYTLTVSATNVAGKPLTALPYFSPLPLMFTKQKATETIRQTTQ